MSPRSPPAPPPPPPPPRVDLTREIGGNSSTILKANGKIELKLHWLLVIIMIGILYKLIQIPV